MMHPFTRACSVLLVLISLSGLACPGGADPEPLPRAHAHNDYLHERPLHDALAHGFTSVEADVHLVGGDLLVAHDLEETQPGRTLQALYLDPLREITRANGGRVYPGGPTLTLLVDLKSEAAPTYEALHGVLAQYAEMLTTFTPEGAREGAVTVIVSGNRPRAMMEAEPVRYAAYDGRLGDLDAAPPPPPAFMPLVSSSWEDVSAWRGEGPLPDSARAVLEAAVRKAHAQGRRLRFWATADRPAVWQVLHEAGVDLINTDDLRGLRAFLLDAREP